MPPGKLASQAGHAYVESLMSASTERQEAYRRHGFGTKICLGVKSLESLMILHNRLKTLEVPCALIEDTGRNTMFGGIPTISALGVGPLTHTERCHLRKYSLV